MAFRTALNVKLQSELYGLVINPDQLVIVPGTSDWGDAVFKYYYWNSTSTDTDDGENVIKPTSIMGDGRYLKLFKTQLQSDWNAGSGSSQILNKPIIPSSPVNADWASGSGLSQVLNKPTIPSAQVNCDWNSVSGVSQMLNKPALATVATSGVYADLTSKPAIPAAQIQSDWTQASSGSLDFIKNKPVVPGKRVETFLGTTDASGNYTVTYGTAFSSTPDVQPQLQAGTTQQLVRITSSTTTGFTVNATNRATVTLLSVDVLLGNTTPLVNASVGVLVTQR